MRLRCILSLSLSLFSPSPFPRRVGTLSRCTRTGGVHGREAIVIRENLTLALDTKEMRMEVIMLRNRGGGALTLSRIRFPLILDSLDCYLMEEEGAASSPSLLLELSSKRKECYV